MNNCDCSCLCHLNDISKQCIISIEIPDKYISISDRYSAIQFARAILTKYGQLKIDIDCIANLYSYKIIFQKVQEGLTIHKHVLKNGIIISAI